MQHVILQTRELALHFGFSFQQKDQVITIIQGSTKMIFSHPAVQVRAAEACDDLLLFIGYCPECGYPEGHPADCINS